MQTILGMSGVMTLSLAASGWWGGPSLPDFRTVTVLSRQRVTEVERALLLEGHLWVSVSDARKINGFALKPEGLCSEKVCIPLPPDGSWTREVDGVTYVDVSAFAERVEQALVTDEEERVWSFSPVPLLRRSAYLAGQAPDFVLPDREGRPVHLSDFRGQKVLLLTWSSW